MKRLEYDFKYDVEKKEIEGKKKTVIKGFANRSFKNGKKIVDRGKEHIPPAEWKFDEWKENPIILFNHNKDVPIGLGTKIEARDEGLWIEAEISQSKSDEITKCRDLIEEKILRSFSVGIDVEEERQVDEAIHLFGVNLIENSVVAVPMNQASQFSVSQKMLKEDPIDKIKSLITKEKGAVLASAIHARIGEMQQADAEFSREKVLNTIAQQSDMSLDQLFEFMAGNIPTAGDKLLDAIAQNLGMNMESLKELNLADESLNPNMIDRPEPGQDANEQMQEEMELDPEPGNDAQLEDDTNQELVDDDAIQLEDDESIELEGMQGDEELEMDEDDKRKSFAECMSRFISEGMEAGKPQDQAIAYAMTKCADEKHCDLDPETMKMIYKNLGEQSVTQPIEGSGYVESNPGNVALHEAKQTNVLLAQLIGEIRSLKQILGATMISGQLGNQTLSKEPDSKKNIADLDIINEYHSKLDKRLSKLGV